MLATALSDLEEVGETDLGGDGAGGTDDLLQHGMKGLLGGREEMGMADDEGGKVGSGGCGRRERRRVGRTDTGVDARSGYRATLHALTLEQGNQDAGHRHEQHEAASHFHRHVHDSLGGSVHGVWRHGLFPGFRWGCEWRERDPGRRKWFQTRNWNRIRRLWFLYDPFADHGNEVGVSPAGECDEIGELRWFRCQLSSMALGDAYGAWYVRIPSIPPLRPLRCFRIIRAVHPGIDGYDMDGLDAVGLIGGCHEVRRDAGDHEALAFHPPLSKAATHMKKKAPVLLFGVAGQQLRRATLDADGGIPGCGRDVRRQGVLGGCRNP